MVLNNKRSRCIVPSSGWGRSCFLVIWACMPHDWDSRWFDWYGLYFGGYICNVMFNISFPSLHRKYLSESSDGIIDWQIDLVHLHIPITVFAFTRTLIRKTYFDSKYKVWCFLTTIVSNNNIFRWSIIVYYNRCIFIVMLPFDAHNK